MLLRGKLLTREANTDRLITPVFILIAVSTFGYFLAVGALIPILPRYVEGPLAGGNVAVGIIIGAFSITAVLLRPFAGRLGDRRGRRILMVLGASSVAVATAGYVQVSSLAPLFVLRAVTGIGEAFFYVGAASAVNDLAPNERRGEAVSFFSLALYSGIAVGPVVGEAVFEAADFSAVWLVSAGAGFIAAAVALLVPETRASDDIGRGSNRLIHPAGLLPGAAMAMSVLSLSGFNTFVPLYALHIGMSGSRFAFVLYAVIVISIRSLGARIPDKLGHLRTARASLIITAIGMTTMAVWAEPAGLFAGTSIFAVGQALAFPALMTIAVDGTPAWERGSVVGTFTAFFDLAFGLGAVSLGAVSELLGYSGLFLTAAGVAVAGMALLAFAPKRVLLGAKAAPRVEESCEPY